MTSQRLRFLALNFVTAAALSVATANAAAADKALLDILLGNGAITQAQYDDLMKKPSLSSADFGAPAVAPAATAKPVESRVDQKVDEALDKKLATRAAQTDDKTLDAKITDRIATKIEEEFPVKASYTDKGFRLESRDGNWQTNLQWRAQMRYTNPTSGDPRQIDNFTADPQSTFENRRLRMKIGGFGYRPWLGYYFELDLQPSRDPDDSSTSASARVIDWRITAAKYDWANLRVGQWKIEHNRERVDSSGRQQFVERSIVNRIFTIDRQVGAQLSGHLFQNTWSDMRYWAGVYTGEGRGVRNPDDKMMYAARLQWNFLGRDLKWKQTDVEYTEKPTGSLGFGWATHEGRCTRWSSSGCGNLDGFTEPKPAADGQFEVENLVQEFAFKWRGWSVQEEFHWKTVEDNVTGTKNDFTGAYAQTGYFFHNLFPVVPKPLELAFRYAFVKEPNETDRALDNTRQEFTIGANWFVAGHNNKFTFDYSYLTLEDEFFNREVNDNRGRVQWDISF
jgi:phosphate-selective porin